MACGPEGARQIDINPELYNSPSPEEAAVKSIAADIWGQRDKGQPAMSFRGAVKQKEDLPDGVGLIISQPGRDVIYGWVLTGLRA